MYVVSGQGYRGPRPVPGPAQVALRDELRGDVEMLSRTIGPRDGAFSLRALHRAQDWIEKSLADAHVSTRLDAFDANGIKFANVEGTIRGTTHPEEIIVLGAHYDTVRGSPGANDNASGVAALLATARRFHGRPLERTLRLVFFVNEESPFAWGLYMGSRVYAERCREHRDQIVAMICIDSLGCYSDAPRSQRYPGFIAWRFPSTGNFVGFCSSEENRALLDRVVRAFRSQAKIDSIGVALGAKDANRSDHASFCAQGYPAVLMSDTSEFRDVNYHQRTDTAEKLDYDGLALACEGLFAVVEDLGNNSTMR